ncbi:leucine-rich repeat protein [Demequina aurantiaca]|uniref:leucine-rich repeat protein n=1 Tax=Demequina aurantiaca TaxID=676200 RepID=UPI003D34084B
MRLSRLIAAATIAAVAALVVAPAASAAGEVWSFTVSGGEATVTGCKVGLQNCGPVIEIPASDGNGNPVTAIGAFALNSILMTSLTLPTSIESIGTAAFQGNYLGDLDLSANTNLTSIGDSAFKASFLTSLKLPPSVESIGTAAFRGNRFGALDLSANTNLTSIGDEVFYAAGVTSLKLPITIESIGTSAFQQTKLGELDLSANTNLTTIGDLAFFLGSTTSLKLPASIESVGTQAFYWNELGALDLSANTNFTSIGTSAFLSSGVTSLKLPATIKSVGTQAFASNEVGALDLGAHTSLTTIGGAAFNNAGVTALELPTSIESIGGSAFGLNDLGVLDLGAHTSLTTIGGSAFSNAGLTALTLPTSIQSIGNSAFASNNLGALDLGANTGLTSINESAFNRAGVTSLTLPTSVESLGIKAFYDNDLGVLDFATSTGLDAIGASAFAANAVTSVKFGGPVSSISASAFSDPTRANYTFAGWLDSVAGGAPTSTFPASTSGATTVSAQWLGDPQTMTFDPTSGSPAPSDQTVAYGDLATTPTAPAWSGHTLSGWFDAATDGTEWDFATDTVDANITLYAQWSLDQHTVTFEPGNGDATTTQDAAWGSAATAPTDPTWTGHAFTGWFDAATDGTEWDFATDTVDANITLYAQWSLDQHTVTFEPGNGDATTTQDAAWGSAATAPTDPTWTGHAFTGWFDAATGGTEWDFATDTVDANITLYAQYTANVPTVTAPATVTPGVAFVVSGTGFDPSEALTVELHSDPVILATILADATGAFSTTVTVPTDTAVGAHQIVVTGASVTASTDVTVQAVLATTGADNIDWMIAIAAALTLTGAALLLRRRIGLPRH